MSHYIIKILPQLASIFIPFHQPGHLPFIKDTVGSAGGGSVTYTQGYGQLSRAGASVMQGVTGHLDISMEIETLSEKFYEDTTQEITNTVESHVRDVLKESSKSQDYRSWWFAFLGGGSGRSTEHYRDQQHDTVTIADTKIFNAASSRMDSEKKKFKVSGSFDIVGQSYIPTTVYLFLETLTIQTSEGQSIVVPTQNIAVADASGNVGAGTTGNKINIMPL